MEEPAEEPDEPALNPDKVLKESVELLNNIPDNNFIMPVDETLAVNYFSPTDNYIIVPLNRPVY